jgi:hypothetical protein
MISPPPNKNYARIILQKCAIPALLKKQDIAIYSTGADILHFS